MMRRTVSLVVPLLLIAVNCSSTSGDSTPSPSGSSSSASGGTSSGSLSSAFSSSSSGQPAHPPLSPLRNDPDPNTDTPNEQVLRMAIKFFGAQRCGDGANWLLVNNPTDNKCHMQDGTTLTPPKDLKGGWHDAGDHLKFTLTHGFSAYGLLKAYDAFPEAFDDYYDERYGGPNGIPDVLDEAKWGIDYLMKVRIGTTLVRRVGPDVNTAGDHKYWYTSPKQSAKAGADNGGDPRPVVTQDAADSAALAAAALALMSRLYDKYDHTTAASYLEEAKAIYEMSRTWTTADDDGMLYKGGSYADDRMGAAAELYMATQDPKYLDEAKTFLNTQPVPGDPSPICWDHSTYLGGHTLLRIYPDAKTPLSWGMNGLQDGSTVWGKYRYVAGKAYAYALWYSNTNDDASKTKALDLLEQIKGKNPEGRSEIVGFGPNPPVRYHHRNASAFDTDSIGDDPAGKVQGPLPKLAIPGMLIGEAQAGVPEEVDYTGDYQHYEGAIDYNANLVGAAAFAVWMERHP